MFAVSGLVGEEGDELRACQFNGGNVDGTIEGNKIFLNRDEL